jgi:hypothetical protein
MPLDRLDHLAFGIFDPASVRDAWRSLGFETTPLGVCRWSAAGADQAAACVSVVFQTHYLDFVELTRSSWLERRVSSPLYAQGVAASAVVLSASSLERALDHVDALGFPSQPAYEIQRELEGRPDEAMCYRFFSVARSSIAIPISAIEDSAPERLRQDRWLSHPNRATGIAALHFRVADAAATAGALSRLAGSLRERTLKPVTDCPLGETRVFFHTAPASDYLAEIHGLIPENQPTALLAIEFRTSSLSAAEVGLQASGITYRQLGIDRIAVAPMEGYGCGIIFVPNEGARDPL